MKALDSFHPAVRDWFLKQFPAPTEPQAQAWPAIKAGKHTLIAAPTGSGKTLAAFLSAIDDLVWKATRGELADETHVVYVSPLKALSNDIKINLEAPLKGIQQHLEASGVMGVEIRTLVRTGDTPAKDRAAMIKKPPHIIVTTPESLYILLTSEGGRKILSTVRTLIVDEIHAMVDDKRGSHLSLSIERLEALVASGYAGVPPADRTEKAAQRAAYPGLIRIGLSATQKPIEEVARFLVGTANLDADGAPRCSIIDSGHARRLDLALEIPSSPLESLMSNEVWEEIYDRITTLIRQHKTTLVFVNTRRMAERVARHLGERLGDDNVTAHHGSLAREIRLSAEQRLKSGELSALVATASLELGIDIGAVDLVIQIGSTRAISTLLQRVGRSNHTVSGFPKGRIFPLSRDELIECTALIDAVRRGELDHLTIPEQPIDILAQQIVAAVAPEEWTEDSLFEMVRRAYPFRNLKREKFDEVVRMLSEGFTTRRGRRGTYLHHDAVNHRIRGRRGARLSAITNGGAIPDTGDYRVILEPSETFVGTLNEDFAIESLAGDIFQLGNTSYEIKRVGAGEVRVLDAHGQPPSIPFWLGEAPGRSDELSMSVSRLRAEIAKKLDDETAVSEPGAVATGSRSSATDPIDPVATAPGSDTRVHTDDSAINWLTNQVGISQAAAQQIVEYLALTKIALGVMPTQEHIVAERFFDENGSTHVVIHAPFGSRLNRAWGLALRKRFCRSFNFELQAAATEDSIVLSLGPTHSFPLDTIFSYLNSKSVCDVLTQALLNAPMFNIRWRWNATRALAIPRWRSGGKVAPQLQRMAAEDLLALVFPDQLACAENLTGPLEVPSHPLVEQTVRDCLEEAMDLHGLEELLRSIERGERTLVAREMNEPSPLAQEILTAKPYAFLDDAPAEERRTLAVMNRRFLDAETAADLGKLDQAAIDRVREEAWPQAENADELHDALMQLGFMTSEEGQKSVWQELFDALIRDRRATLVSVPGAELMERGHPCPHETSVDSTVDFELASKSLRARMPALHHVAPGTDTFWVAAERLNQLRAIHPHGSLSRQIESPEPYASESWNFDDALVEMLRGRLEGLGPVTVAGLAKSFSLPADRIQIGLAKLEGEGFAMQGQFTPPGTQASRPASPIEEQHAETRAYPEWCSRRLLARIHRYTLNRLRKEVEPVSAADFMRFLFVWQKVAPEHRVEGASSVAAILDQLEGFEAPAGSWESEILPARIADYDPAWLDALCVSGKLTWLRLSPPRLSPEKVSTSSPVRSTPMVLLNRKNLRTWTAAFPPQENAAPLSTNTQTVYEYLKENGASFFVDIVSGTDLLASMVEEALGELVFRGMVTADSFTGLRALLTPLSKTTHRAVEKRRRRKKAVYSMDEAGRWVRLGTHASGVQQSEAESKSEHAGGVRTQMEAIALKLLQRYGVVFRKILDRESISVPWRDLLRVLRRLEARGEIRGGRFLGGFSGEQFATPEAVQLLRSIRRAPVDGSMISVSAADPLNLLGIVLPTGRLAGFASNRVLYRDGAPTALMEAKEIRFLVEMTPAEQWQARQALLRRHVPPKVRAYLNQTGRTVSPPQVSTLTH